MNLAPEPGLCETCRHARILANRRGSRFLLCTLAREDPIFARYPTLPVWRCRGFAAMAPGERAPAVPASSSRGLPPAAGRPSTDQDPAP